MFNCKLEVFLVTLVHPAGSSVMFKRSFQGSKRKIKWLSGGIVIFTKNQYFVGKIC